MRGILSLLATMVLAFGILSGALVHATEVAGSPELAFASNSSYIAGDADEVRGDADKATPHHHNVCHGHDVAAPFSQTGDAPACFTKQPVMLWRILALPENPHFGLLRPPQI